MSVFNNSYDCPYKKLCENKNKFNNDCYKMCNDFNDMNLLFQNSLIPKRYIKPFTLYPSHNDVEIYEILNNIKNNLRKALEESFNLYIFSKLRQNGKTSWAIKLLQTHFHNVKAEGGSKKRGLYIDIPFYLSNLKASFNDYSEDKYQILEKDLDVVDLVIWDNIDENKLTEWDRNIIKQHIKRRIDNNLSNIYVGSNINGQLINAIGSDLAYYIQSMSTVLELYGERGDFK